jgi:hypothetical protein
VRVQEPLRINKEKFERLAEVLGVENPLQHMAEIMEQALDIALDKKDLKRKRARRLERKPRNADNSGQKSCPGKIPAESRYFGAAFIQEKIAPSRRSPGKTTKLPLLP